MNSQTHRSTSLRDLIEFERGDCYRRAVELAERVSRSIPDDFGVEVVHGLVTGAGGDVKGKRYGHAWVEINRGVCLDDSQGGAPHQAPAFLYYEAGQISPDAVYRYSLREAHREMVDQGHYGPWHLGLSPRRDRSEEIAFEA